MPIDAFKLSKPELIIIRTKEVFPSENRSRWYGR